MPLEALASEYAGQVPVYVRQARGGYEIVDASGRALSAGHPSVRHALDAALVKLSGSIKAANLRNNGRPDGQWRWLDATATEDQSDDGARISENAIWEMAAQLNERASAIPINGGGAPPGYKPSEPHGDGRDGGDHPANGFAHLGVPVLERGRLHLYLRAELLPEIAVEVDRGRLAYGSVRVGFEATDPEDDHAMVGAELISHALTNDPAITTLSPGSERQPNHAHVAQFTRRIAMEDQPDPALYARMMEWMRNVLQKPDATMEEAMAELEARTEEVGAVLGTDPQPAPEPGPDAEPAAEEATNPDQEDGGKEPTMSEKKEQAADSESALRAELAAHRRELEAEKKKRREAEAKATAAAHREADAKWLDEQIKERKLVVNAERRERLLNVTRKAGRETALELLSDPPSTPELDHRAPATGTKGAKGESPQVVHVREAERAIREEIREAGRPMPTDYTVYRRAILKALEEHPEAFKRAV